MSRIIRPLALVLLATGCAHGYDGIIDAVDGPGVQMAVIEPDGDTWSGAAGDANVDEPATTEHAFLIGSNTKVFTAAIVLQLVDQGSLTLDDSAATWVPQLDEAITVRNLLQHTSGLGEYLDHEDMAEDNQGMSSRWTPQELISLGQEVRNDGPTEEAEYANTNFIALGLLIEAVDGRTYAESLRARVFEPLGMTRSGLIENDGAIPDHLAFGEAGEWGVPTHTDPSVGWSTGSAYASATDLARFLDAALGGELYSPELVDEQHDVVHGYLGFDESDDLRTYYGLGLMVVDMEGTTIDGHIGGVDGFRSSAMQDPETGALVVVLCNSTPCDAITPTVKALKMAGRE